MNKRVLVPIADGSEEIEAVTIIDVLRRSGAQVVVASVNGIQITASRNVKIVADCLIDACSDQTFDLIVLPGGMPGAENLKNNRVLKQMLERHSGAGHLFGAICAAPAVVLESHGLLHDRKATCHPDHAGKIQGAVSPEPVVVDGNCITSQGPGTAMAFALSLVEQLFGREKMAAVAAPMIIR